MYQLTSEEKNELVVKCDQFKILSTQHQIFMYLAEHNILKKLFFFSILKLLM